MLRIHQLAVAPVSPLLLAMLLGLSLPLPAAEGEPDTAPGRPERSPDQELTVTRHEAVIDGRRVPYEATAGYMVVEDEEGVHKANVFFIAYRRTDVRDSSQRPLSFSFNGGPGSSSVWLHLGVFGPQRVEMDPEGRPLPPPYRLVPNEHSFLDLSDWVFVDPVTTGYSRAAVDEDPQQFHGLDEDSEWMSEFIRLYVTRFERWSSPKFLAGESYGTTRVAALVRHLQQRHGMYFNGVLLVSSILNFQTARFDVGNDLPYILFLPTYAATAWYHDRLEPELQRDLRATLDEVEEFALNDYALALLRGAHLPPEERQRIAARLARYTGLSADYVARANLRVHIFRFVKELRRDDGLTVGRLDSRFSGIDRDDAGEGFEYDPSYAAIQGPYTATLNDYVRRQLEYENDLPYEILSGRVRPWSYAAYENRYVNVAERLRQAMTQNRDLKVFVASGYYDLATPHFATDYTLAQMELPDELRGNISVHYYESGHMMYIREADLAKMKSDGAEFYRRATAER